VIDEHAVVDALDCAYVLPSPRADVATNRRMTFASGRIATVESCDPATVRPILALPALVNAHDHARPVRASSFGAGDKPLEAWLHYSAMLPPVDPYLATAVSLARSALGGAGTVMVHYTRVQGITDLVTEAQQVARAARDVGVRVGFAVALRDINPLVYGPSEPILARLPPPVRAEIERRFPDRAPAVHDMLAGVDAIAAACDEPDFNVQYGPAGVQWCSPALLGAVSEASARTGRRVHMHLLETRYQREWADREFPQGIVVHLDEIGLLSPRLTLAHCTWARPDELELIAMRGATIAVNTSSNLGIRSGVAPVAEMIRRGCRVALGLDGLALDEDDDALRELRLGYLLHTGTGFAIDVDRATMLEIAVENGRRSVLNVSDAIALAPGAPADVLVLDWQQLDADRLLPASDPRALLFSRATARHVDALIVAGRTVVRQGEVVGVDFPALQAELLARLRAGIAQNADLAVALPSLTGAIAASLEPRYACCW
jgi:cytosine/adenosine deaminase-related metal-dependent hydrolase